MPGCDLSELLPLTVYSLSPCICTFFSLWLLKQLLKLWNKHFPKIILFPCRHLSIDTPFSLPQPLLLHHVFWISRLCSFLPTGLAPKHLSWSALTKTGVFQLRLHQHWLKEEDYFLYLPDDVVFISQSDVWLFCGRVALLKDWSAPDL